MYTIYVCLSVWTYANKGIDDDEFQVILTPESLWEKKQLEPSSFLPPGTPFPPSLLLPSVWKTSLWITPMIFQSNVETKGEKGMQAAFLLPLSPTVPASWNYLPSSYQIVAINLKDDFWVTHEVLQSNKEDTIMIWDCWKVPSATGTFVLTMLAPVRIGPHIS